MNRLEEIDELKKKINKLENDKYFLLQYIKDIAFYVRKDYNINVDLIEKN